MNVTFGEMLRQHRLSAGLKIIELAKRMSVHPSAISMWELNKTPPCKQNWNKLQAEFPNLK